MKVNIICPLYNAEKYIVNLNKSFLMQEDVVISKISYILTESKDNTEKLLNEDKIEYKKIKKEEFSHSLVRENAAMESDSDILVFVTQDIVIEDKFWLKNLISPIESDECVASFSRQISKFKNIEKYTREKNYPAESYINSKEDIETKGLKAFFFSDASSAIKTDVFKSLGGYDGKNLPINEDMYIAYKLIINGYKIKYCAESVVYHSHKFTLKQLYDRYYLTGQFMAQNSYLDEYGTTKAGGGLAKYVLKRAICQFNIPVLFRYFPDMYARWHGMKKGKKSILKKTEKNK